MERSAYSEVAVEYSSEKHNYNYCELICHFLDKYLVFSNKYLVQANQLQCRQIDSDRVGETTLVM